MKRRRLSLGLSQAALADLIRVDERTVRRVEKGEFVDVGTIERLAVVFGRLENDDRSLPVLVDEIVDEESTRALTSARFHGAGAARARGKVC